MSDDSPETQLQVRVDGDRSNPALIYLPGVHGDWTLLASFRELAKEKFHFLQITYPRTLSWSLDDYAAAVSNAVSGEGVTRGYILGESYSSQVAWNWLERCQPGQSSFTPLGLILAGGFVRYPFPFVARLTSIFLRAAPWWTWKMLFWVYARYSIFRHRHAPESASSIHEFIARRTPLDIAAIRHRVDLLAANDPRRMAREISCPVFLLAGFIDPVVPTWPVLRWLRKHCPALKGSRIIWPADHNVLGTEPEQALRQIEEWIGQCR